MTQFNPIIEYFDLHHQLRENTKETGNYNKWLSTHMQKNIISFWLAS